MPWIKFAAWLKGIIAACSVVIPCLLLFPCYWFWFLSALHCPGSEGEVPGFSVFSCCVMWDKTSFEWLSECMPPKLGQKSLQLQLLVIKSQICSRSLVSNCRRTWRKIFTKKSPGTQGVCASSPCSWIQKSFGFNRTTTKLWRGSTCMCIWMCREREGELCYYFSRAAQKNLLKIRILKKLRKKIEIPQIFLILPLRLLQMKQVIFLRYWFCVVL